jgi:hypothetical protein
MWTTIWDRLTGWVRLESAAATAMVQAFIALGIAFSWWTWSTAQTGAVIGIVSALLGMFVRSQVTPNVRVAQRRPVPARAPAGPAPAVRPAPGAPQAGPAGGPAPDFRPSQDTDPPGGPSTRPL